MDARVRSALLWGLVGAFSTLVAVQTYGLFVGPHPLGFAGTVGLAFLVAVVVTLVAYATEHRIARTG